MPFKLKNQKELLNIFGIKHLYDKKPISRFKVKPRVEDKAKLLEQLKKKIEDISDCELKKSAKRLVFADGNILSPLMIVGEGPGKKEDEIGKPFVGDAGSLLNKMLNAINIKRNDIYLTNVVNYRPPNNRKPEMSEIKRYSEFLKEHINLIKPKILILMGSTAMESLVGNKEKISKIRGIWLDILINNESFKTMVTFHPAYLLRQPEQKKYSWEDLKKIKKEIDNLGLDL